MFISVVDCAQPLYLAHAKENASEASAKHAHLAHAKENANEASAKHAGLEGRVCELFSLPFALTSSSLPILPACSTLE